MVGAINHNRNRQLPCVCILDGEHGEKDIAMGVPCVRDEQDMSRMIDLELTDEEMPMFRGSAGAVRADIGLLSDPEGSG
jgi:malate dehydrogenase